MSIKKDYGVFQVLNPTQEQSNVIYEKTTEVGKKGNSKNITDIDYGNDEILKILLKELIVSEDEKYNFKNMSDGELVKRINEPDEVMEDMSFELGLVLSDVIERKYKEYLSQIKIAKVKVLESQTIHELNDMTEIIANIAKNERDKKEQERIEEILKERDFDKIDLAKLTFFDRIKFIINPKWVK